MGVGIKLAGAVALLALTAGAQGCVSLGTYEDQKRKIEALEAAYGGADGAVGQQKRENDRLRAENAGLKMQLATADQRTQNANMALKASYDELQAKYQDMIEKLQKGEGGGDIEINSSTHGIVLGDDIFFQPGKAELRGEKTAILAKLVEKLKAGDFAGAEIEIAGHTDSDPIHRSTWKDNFQLSCERARNVLVFFREHGIGEDRLHVAGYGPTKPRGQNKAQNRRVEIVLFQKA
jgi:flagellar motor protein MotB